jgi:hypothetical protein
MSKMFLHCWKIGCEKYGPHVIENGKRVCLECRDEMNLTELELVLLAELKRGRIKSQTMKKKCVHCDGTGWLWAHQAGDYETDQRYPCTYCEKASAEIKEDKK